MTKTKSETKLIEDTYLEYIKEKIGVDAVGSKEVIPYDVIPSGSLILDKVLGIGGFPLKSIVEIWGRKGSGKTSIAMNTTKEAQKMGYDVLYIDVEGHFDNNYAQAIGIDFNKIFIQKTGSGENSFAENILQSIEKALMDSKYTLIILDSLAAITPRKWFEDGMIDYDKGGQFAAIASMLPKPLNSFNKYVVAKNKLLLILNQARANIGGGLYSHPDIKPCGYALSHIARIILQLSPSDAIKKGEERIGHWILASTIEPNKSKVAPPTKDKFPLIYGKGIDNVIEVIELGKNLNIFENKEGKIAYKEYVLGKNLEIIRGFFRDNPSVFSDLVMDIKSRKE